MAIPESTNENDEILLKEGKYNKLRKLEKITRRTHWHFRFATLYSKKAFLHHSCIIHNSFSNFMCCRYHNYPLYFDYIVRFHKTNLTKIIYLRNFHNGCLIQKFNKYKTQKANYRDTV